MSDPNTYEKRNQRITDLLRAELSSLILRDLKDPRVDMATVNAIDLAGDLSQAKVYVSVLGDDPERRAECIAGLTSASGYLRRQLSHRLDLRTIPKLEFVLDRGAEHSQMISALLDELPIPDDQMSQGDTPADDDDSQAGQQAAASEEPASQEPHPERGES